MLHLVSGINSFYFLTSFWYQFLYFRLTYFFTHHVDKKIDDRQTDIQIDIQTRSSQYFAPLLGAKLYNVRHV